MTTLVNTKNNKLSVSENTIVLKKLDFFSNPGYGKRSMGTRTEIKIEYLKKIFHGTDDLIRDLERITHMVDVTKGQLIAGPQINCDKVYILNKGSINLYFVYDGKKIIIDALKQGDFFGDINGVGSLSGVCDDAPFVEAREDSVLSVTNSRDLYRLIQKYPELGIQFLQNFGNRLARAERKIQDLALRPVSERIVRELTHLAEINGENEVRYYRLDSAITHEQLAMMVGATRETVTKALTLLRSKGIVNMRDNRYIINKQMTQPKFYA